jgi:hypothetical protein
MMLPVTLARAPRSANNGLAHHFRVHPTATRSFPPIATTHFCPHLPLRHSHRLLQRRRHRPRLTLLPVPLLPVLLPLRQHLLPHLVPMQSRSARRPHRSIPLFRWSLAPSTGTTTAKAALISLPSSSRPLLSPKSPPPVIKRSSPSHRRSRDYELGRQLLGSRCALPDAGI